MTLPYHCDGCQEHWHPDRMRIVRRAFEELALCPPCAEAYEREHPEADVQPCYTPVPRAQLKLGEVRS